jgi:23S rRNA (guanosine2251-2'-O)-methyltransferase
LEKKNLIYGRRNVLEYLSSQAGNPGSSYEIFIKEGTKGIEEIYELIPPRTKKSKLSGQDFEGKFKGISHQGVVVVIKEGADNYLSLGDLKDKVEGEERFPILILDRIQDAGNLGSILRTAECFGFKDVVIPDRDSAKITDAVIKTSSGAIHKLHLYHVANLAQVVDFLKENNYWVVAATEKGSEDWKNLPEPQECALIMGNEHEGIKKILLEKSDFQFRIPIHGEIGSLNVAISTGIFMDRIVNR